MEKRPFGRSGHMSTVAILGGAAFGEVDQVTADKAMEIVLEYGINHIDIAPSYGHAEDRLAPWMKTHRGHFFLGCKTMERTREGALEEMHSSLKRMHTDHFDLYQLHAVKKIEDLDVITRPGGALEALVEAKKNGSIGYIGITGHGIYAPAVFIEALRRFEFDSVLFPVNFVQYAEATYKQKADELLHLCHEKNVGSMLIKSITKAPWGDNKPIYDTWYEPFADMEMIQKAISFALSQDATGICTVGDTRLLPLVLKACENFKPMPLSEQTELINSAQLYKALFMQ
jgi:aryl-alcohol dehydrogenase-like predicted oxidoreductase